MWAADDRRWAIKDRGSQETVNGPGQPTIQFPSRRGIHVPRVGSGKLPSHRERTGPVHDAALDSYSGRARAGVSGVSLNTSLRDRVVMHEWNGARKA